MSWYVKAKLECWVRQDNMQMFDFTQKQLKKYQLNIFEEGSIFRHIENYSIIFVKKGQSKLFSQNLQYEWLARIRIQNGQKFFIYDKIANENEILYKMAGQQENASDTITQADSIRIGKTNLIVQKITIKQQFHKNYYERMCVPTICQQPTNQIVIQTYSTELGNPSLIDEAYFCKYCYSKNAQNTNPLISICQCQGSNKYIHVQCLISWIKKRPNFSMNEERGVCILLTRNLICEVCKGQYDAKKIYSYLFNKFDCQFAIIRILGQTDRTCFLDLEAYEKQQKGQQDKCTFKIGRNGDNDIIINQLTVSRHHSKLIFNKKTKTLSILDQNSKFGTGIQVKKTKNNELINQCKFQKGRTLMTFKKMQNKSFLPRFLSFCCTQKQILQKQSK